MTQVTGRASGSPGDVGAARARTEAWLLDLVHSHRLSPTQRRVVQSMLDSMPDVAFMSTVDVAELAGVSQPTVVRLASALGFKGYPEFRAAVRRLALSSDEPLNVPERRSALGIALAAEQSNIAALERTLDSDRAVRGVEALAGTHPLGILGIRASSALAQYMGYFASRIIPGVRVLTDAGTLDDDLFELRDDGASALLAYVMPRYPLASVLALRHARELGMTTIVVTDSHLVPFSDDADVLLVAPVGADLIFDTHGAALTLSTALLDAVARHDPVRSQARLEAHELLVDRWAFSD
ncbi:MAG: MurR/RpiR family transcriptional regulator [Geodermatophilaceae bacterium]|nr:MurR/RpiR family transcriptional regulator [Geodermatophilaceae bacterium]